jgi:hypothetical protein
MKKEAIRNRPLALGIIVPLLITGIIIALPGQKGEEELLREIKLMMFELNFGKAEAHCRNFIARYPESKELETIRFYLARSMEKQGKLEQGARAYRSFIASYGEKSPLAEQAKLSLISVLGKLLRKTGKREQITELSSFLSDADKVVSYYAALELSQGDDEAKRMAKPVLYRALGDPLLDETVKDRVKLALLKVDKEARIVETPVRKESGKISWIKLRVYRRGEKTPSVVLNFPIVLADLVINSLTEEQKKELVKETGIDIENIWKSIKEVPPGPLFKMMDKKSGETIEIWVE